MTDNNEIQPIHKDSGAGEMKNSDNDKKTKETTFRE